jgi:arsenite methyltransferase
MTVEKLNVDLQELRTAIREEYESVACEPKKGYHFHTGQPLAAMLGYKESWLDGIPEGSVESFAGTGNPFSMGELNPGEQVVDVGCGAGIDSLIAARMVAPGGRVIAIDMTQAMLDKATTAAKDAGIDNAEFRLGFGEELPAEDQSADVLISNGVLNLMPDKGNALQEMARVLKPGGRLQIGDILVQKPVPDDAKRQIDLWTG